MSKIDKIVIASRNPAKVDYYRGLFTGRVKEVFGLADFGVEGKPEETGETSEDNARIKAMFYHSRVGLPVFCEDEALYVDFLPPEQQPGTHIRRINGVDEVDDDILIAHWERIVSQVPENKRTGHWHIAYCFALSEERIRITAIDHYVKFFYPPSKIRIRGWPMSSLEGSVALNKPNSEVTAEEKLRRLETEAEAILKKLEEVFI